MGVKVVASKQGLVVETDGQRSIVLTPEGEFVKLPLAGREVRVGEEISFTVPEEKVRLFRPWAWAACLALAILLAGLLLPVYPAVAYWVSLDINPSLELGVNAQDRVVRVVPLDTAGRQLVVGQPLWGRKVEQAIQRLITRAADLGYGRQEGDLVLVTVTGEKRADAACQEKVARTAEEAVAELQGGAQVVVVNLPAAAHREARRLGLSAGQYAAWRALKESGVSLEPEEMKNKGLAALAREKQRDLRALLAPPESPPASRPGKKAPGGPSRAEEAQAGHEPAAGGKGKEEGPRSGPPDRLPVSAHERRGGGDSSVSPQEKLVPPRSGGQSKKKEAADRSSGGQERKPTQANPESSSTSIHEACADEGAKDRKQQAGPGPGRSP